MVESNKTNYLNTGYAHYSNFLSSEDVGRINDIIDNLDLKPSETVFDENNTGKIKQIQYLYKYHPFFQKILDRLEPIAKELTSVDDLHLLNMQLFEKHPKISKPTRAHQDNAYFKVKPATALTFWIALDDIDEENGCLYYAPYTHLTPTRKHQRYHPHTTFRLRSGVPGLSLCLHEHPEETDQPMPCQAGDMLVHNCNLVHRAGKNNSINRKRRAIGVVYIPKICQEDPLLIKYHNNRLKEDIELQRIKNPSLYEELQNKFKNLYD